MLTSGQNQLSPSRGYTAETYAKVMGSSSPSQPRIKPKYTLFVCKWIEGDGWVLPPIVYTVSPPLRGGVAFAPRTLGVTTTPSPTDDARGEASGEGRGWCAMLRLQDAQSNACEGRLGQQWRHLPAQGCRVGRREGAAMMPPLGCRPASVRSTRPSLQLELQHHLRHRISS